MKMSVISRLILTGLAMSLAGALVVAQAANSGGITRDYDVVVPPSQNHAFREGLKHWEKCLRDHGASQVFYVYDAETGDTSTYSILVPHASWADIDQHTAAGKACRETFGRSVAPHFTDAISALLKVNAKMTYDPGESSPTTPVAWVLDYRIKPGKYHSFMAAVHAITAAATKTQWEGHYIGYDVLAGGPGSPQVLIVQPNNSWADAGKMPNPSMRKMMESVYGKTATAALLHKLGHSIRDAWSRIWSYDKELSFVPAKSQ